MKGGGRRPLTARTRIRVSPRPSRARLAYGCIYEEADVFISQAFAQTAPAAAAGDTQSSLLSLLPLVLMFVVLYFIMIRPQMKRQKEHKAMIEALAKGDEVVTAGGVLGRVSKLGETLPVHRGRQRRRAAGAAHARSSRCCPRARCK